MAQIASKLTERANASGIAMRFPDLIETTEFESCTSKGLVSVEAIAHVGIYLLLEMKAQFVVEILLDGVSPEERAKTKKQIAQHRFSLISQSDQCVHFGCPSRGQV